jgi:FHA domain-containing protein
VCGTINLMQVIRCIACGSAMEPATPEPVKAQRGTVMMHPDDVQALMSESQKLPEPVDGPAPAAAEPEPTAEPVGPPRKYLLRLLVADIGPSNVEVADKPLTLGSGRHDIGENGDPCIGPAEGKLFVVAGDLYLEPAPDAQGLYLKLRDEAKLEGGDVILLGYVAAQFTDLPKATPVDGTRQVIGGTAATPCARLTFLRRDGSPGPLHDIPAGKTILGRTGGHLNFPEDSRLSRQHACLVASENGVRVEDMDSRNGTFLRVRQTVKLEPGDALRVGSAGLIVRGVTDA